MNLTWDFWVILKTDVFLKAIIAFWLCKKSVRLYKFYYQIPEFYKKWKTLSIIFSSPNFLLELRFVLYFERKKRSSPEPLAGMVSEAHECSLPLPQWPKQFGISILMISFVLSLAFRNLPALLVQLRGPPWFRLYLYDHHVVGERWS